MLTLLDKHCIIHDHTLAYSPESISIAEWYNHTSITTTHTILTGFTLASRGKGDGTAVYLRNRLPSQFIGKSMPDKSLYNK